MCLEDASNDSASVCVGSFKAIAKAALYTLKVYYSDSGYSHGSIHSDRLYFDAPTGVMIVGFPLANAPLPKETGDDSPYVVQMKADMEGLFSVLYAMVSNTEVVPSALVLDRDNSIETFRSVHLKELSDGLLKEIDIALGVSGGYDIIMDDPSKDNYTKKDASLKCTGYGLLIGLKAGTKQFKTIPFDHCYFTRIGGTGVGSEMSAPDI